MSDIKDVAREAGVSIATVSRALRGLPRVSQETRERVLAAAARMEYVASPQASSLASGLTHTVGVVVPNVTRWFFGSVIHGAEELLRREGYDMLLYNITGDEEARRRLFSTHLLGKRVDAVMVLALHPTPEEIASLARTGGPAVLVGGTVPEWPSVCVDDVRTASARRAAPARPRAHPHRPHRRHSRPGARGSGVLHPGRPSASATARRCGAPGCPCTRPGR